MGDTVNPTNHLAKESAPENGVATAHDNIVSAVVEPVEKVQQSEDLKVRKRRIQNSAAAKRHRMKRRRKQERLAHENEYYRQKITAAEITIAKLKQTLNIAKLPMPDPPEVEDRDVSLRKPPSKVLTSSGDIASDDGSTILDWKPSEDSQDDKETENSQVKETDALQMRVEKQITQVEKSIMENFHPKMEAIEIKLIAMCKNLGVQVPLALLRQSSAST